MLLHTITSGDVNGEARLPHVTPPTESREAVRVVQVVQRPQASRCLNLHGFVEFSAHAALNHHGLNHKRSE